MSIILLKKPTQGKNGEDTVLKRFKTSMKKTTVYSICHNQI